MNTIGTIGESAVYHDLLKKKYTVYFTMSEGAKFDFIAYRKDKGVQTVEVKTTQTRTPEDTGWKVKLKRSKKNKEDPFDSSEIDILAVYVEPLGVIHYIDAKSVTNVASMTIPDPTFKNFKKLTL